MQYPTGRYDGVKRHRTPSWLRQSLLEGILKSLLFRCNEPRISVERRVRKPLGSDENIYQPLCFTDLTSLCRGFPPLEIVRCFMNLVSKGYRDTAIA